MLNSAKVRDFLFNLKFRKRKTPLENPFHSFCMEMFLLAFVWKASLNFVTICVPFLFMIYVFAYIIIQIPSFFLLVDTILLRIEKFVYYCKLWSKFINVTEYRSWLWYSVFYFLQRRATTTAILHLWQNFYKSKSFGLL